MDSREKGMLQGLCLAAVYLANEGEKTLAFEVLKEHGITKEKANEAEVDEYDFGVIWGEE